MAVSLRRPDLVRDIIAVDNAPVEAMLGSSFGQYVQAMRRIEDAKLQKQNEADSILKEYEPVSNTPAAFAIGRYLLCSGPYLTISDFFFFTCRRC